MSEEDQVFVEAEVIGLEGAYDGLELAGLGAGCKAAEKTRAHGKAGPFFATTSAPRLSLSSLGPTTWAKPLPPLTNFQPAGRPRGGVPSEVVEVVTGREGFGLPENSEPGRHARLAKVTANFSLREMRSFAAAAFLHVRAPPEYY